MPIAKFKVLHTIQFPNGTEKVPLRIEGRSQVNQTTGERLMVDRVKVKEAVAGDVLAIDTDSDLYKDIKVALVEAEDDAKVTFEIPGTSAPVEPEVKTRKPRAPKGANAADTGNGEQDLV